MSDVKRRGEVVCYQTKDVLMIRVLCLKLKVKL